MTPASLVRFQPSLPIVGANSGSFAPPHAAGLIPSVAPPPQTEILISVWSRAKGVGPYVPVFISYDPLAQLVEHLPFKPVVRGSSPRRVTRRKTLQIVVLQRFEEFFLLSLKLPGGAKNSAKMVQTRPRCGYDVATKRRQNKTACSKERAPELVAGPFDKNSFVCFPCPRSE